jgi:hypothetical protein
MLVEGVSQARDGASRSEAALMADVAATWSIVHGLADLLTSERLKYIQGLKPDQREAMLVEIIQRVTPPGRKS